MIWGGAWLFKATKEAKYGNYVLENMHMILGNSVGYAEFGSDTKHAGINILVSKVTPLTPFL